jgi:zona occludens toxin (predicted ATPase)
MNFDSAGSVAKTIWLVVGFLIAAIIFTNASNDAPFDWTQMAAIGAMVTAAFLSTAATFGITMAAMEKFGMQQSQADQRDSKQKNSGRKVREMLNRLSDEELEMLRDTLKEESSGYGLSDDGEIVQKRVK